MDAKTQQQYAETFHGPHRKGDPLVLFNAWVTDLALIERFVQLTPLPVNIMVTQGVPEIPDLARVWVRRVSLGPTPMMAAMRVIGQAAAAVASSKQYGTFLQPNA
ncbi:isocitrate lyase/phosphoenolpyruvate mutase family protein [Bradyrhizobium erythrophlei]|uniref:isocitrate lyase/phosphoenolpyruvate mutase family protein n=1 Tax=Bradyrhizobium erythrophlei TaxID=1437360 RepID=UPI0035F09C7A